MEEEEVSEAEDEGATGNYQKNTPSVCRGVFCAIKIRNQILIIVANFSTIVRKLATINFIQHMNTCAIDFISLNFGSFPLL